MSLRASIEIVLEEYPKASQSSYRGSPAADFIRNTIPEEIGKIIGQNDRYIVEGSAGRGVWTKVPWIGIFDRSITESAQDGYYVVYLFREDFDGIYLSLNQGVTTVREQYGTDAKHALRIRAEDFVARLGNETSGLQTGRIDLAASSPSSLAAFYEQGSICSRYYQREQLPSDEELAQNLEEFINLYFNLTLRAVSSSTGSREPDEENLNSEDLINLRNHKRMERNSGLAKRAKKVHGTICQACGFDFEKAYGQIGRDFIEAHHLTPLSLLKGQIVNLDPKKDFCTLCANCHRMIHRSEFVSDLQGFQAHYIRV